MKYACRQEDITKALCDFLETLGYHILASHHPGASGGLKINLCHGKQSKQYIVPDIVAIYGDKCIVAEVDIRYNKHSVHKLQCFMASDTARLDLLQVLSGLGYKIQTIVPGIAYIPPRATRSNLPTPPNFVVFHFINGKITVYVGKEMLLLR